MALIIRTFDECQNLGTTCLQIGIVLPLGN